MGTRKPYDLPSQPPGAVDRELLIFNIRFLLRVCLFSFFADCLTQITPRPRPDHPKTTPRSPQDHAKITPRPRQDRPLKKYCFFIKNTDLSLEIIVFEPKQSVLHYVLRRELEMFAKNVNFELEICVKACGGRTALQPEAFLSL